MPKRKATGKRKQPSKRQRQSDPPKCLLLLPQEVLDKIIEFSLNVDTVLGILPHHVQENFPNPFMHVNRACRAQTIELISSLTWIELRSLDRTHTDFVARLASHISPVDPFWSSVISHSKESARVVLEFGRTTARSTRQHVNDCQVFLAPYSYSSMLRIVSEVGLALPKLKCFNITLEWMPLGHLDEVESVLKFLNHSHRVTTPNDGYIGRNFSFWRDNPPSMDLVMNFVALISQTTLELFAEGTRASHMRAKLVYLYMSRCVAHKAENVLPWPYSWTVPGLGGPTWPSNSYATNWMKITQMIYHLEMDALQAFGDITKTDIQWMHHQAPYLTNGYNRFIREPRFTYFSISDIELVDYYRKVGRVVTVYNLMSGLILEPIQDFSLLLDRLRRKTRAFKCASKLQPDNECYENDATAAQVELLKYFPREGREELMREYKFHHYTDVDGEKRQWLENDICQWDTRSLQYLHRARQIQLFSDSDDELGD